MNMRLQNERFEFVIKEDTLTFKTPFYKAERGSILHKEIFNLELASLLASLVPGAVVFIVLSSKTRTLVLPSLFAFFTLIGGFILFRIFVFIKRELKFAIHKKSGSVFLRMPFRKVKVFRISDVKNVEAKMERFSPENPEGMALVEKIALHHGQVVPDFGSPGEIYSVNMELRNGAIFRIYAGPDKDSAADVTTRIKEFLER